MAPAGRQKRQGIRFLRALTLPVTAGPCLSIKTVESPPPTFLADRNATHWYDGAPLPASDSVTGKIGQFTPDSIPTDVWNRIEDDVRRSVEAAGPATSYRAGVLLNAVTQLAFWVDSVGLPLQADCMLRPETIDRFVFEGLCHLSSGTQTNYRSQLRVVAKAVVGATVYPPTGIVPRPNPRLPYTPDQVSAIVSWATGQPTELTRRNALALVAIGLGSGLSSQEITRLTGDDILADDAGVIIRVIGDKARDVPVLRRWEDQVVDFAIESGSRPYFLPSRKRITGHGISNFVDRCSRAGAPELTVQRLRTTWIVGQLVAGTPLPILTSVAGVDATQLSRYFKLMPEPDQKAVRQQIRAASP